MSFNLPYSDRCFRPKPSGTVRGCLASGSGYRATGIWNGNMIGSGTGNGHPWTLIGSGSANGNDLPGRGSENVPASCPWSGIDWPNGNEIFPAFQNGTGYDARHECDRGSWNGTWTCDRHRGIWSGKHPDRASASETCGHSSTENGSLSGSGNETWSEMPIGNDVWTGNGSDCPSEIGYVPRGRHHHHVLHGPLANGYDVR